MKTVRHHLVLLVVLTAAAFSAPVFAQQIPQQLSDREFWQMVTEFSEAGGVFRSDNFVSNERSFQFVVPELKRTTPTGGVYLGVGPEQNFTYIVALQPRISFIVDIRRQNMLLHLMYKALIEMSADRAEFLSRLFSRELVSTLGPDTTAIDLLVAYRRAAPDEALFEKNLRLIEDRLVRVHGLALTERDLTTIAYVYKAFYSAGPELNYSWTPRSLNAGSSPAMWEVLIAKDGEGHNESYLESENYYRALKTLHEQNRIIPIVGDFAGPRALQTIGRYLREHDATVTAFYTSNVEQYLFGGSEAWKAFFTNVASLPLDAKSLFIRSTFHNRAIRVSSHPYARSVTLLAPMQEMVKAFQAGQIQSYLDVVLFDMLPAPQ